MCLHACLLALCNRGHRQRHGHWRLLALAGGGGGGGGSSGLCRLLQRLLCQHVLHLGHDVLAIGVLAQRLDVRLQQ